MLEAPWGEAETRVEADGTQVLESFDSYGAARNASHGQLVGSNVRMRYAIPPDDPATARFDCNWVFEFARDDWAVRIETDSRMTCDRATFYLWRGVKASEGEGLVLARGWQEEIPRGCH